MSILEKSYGVETFLCKRFDLEIFQSNHVVLEPYWLLPTTNNSYGDTCLLSWHA